MPAAAVIPAPIAYINVRVVPYANVAHLCSTCSTDNGVPVAPGATNLHNLGGCAGATSAFFSGLVVDINNLSQQPFSVVHFG